jgi:TatD DNase family protein
VARPKLGQAMPEFYDTHAHLDFPDFREELDEVVQRAADVGISRIVTIGTDLESSRRAIDLAKRFDGVFAAVGWHPNDCLSAPDDVRGELEGLAKAAKVVAIGEIGIDHYRLPSTRGGSAADDEAFKARQVSLFQQQLEVAAKLGLNVVIHQRAAFEACIEVFEPFADRVRGVFHCFVNDPAAAQRVIDLGSLVSFTGVCTFKNAGDVRESLASVPLDKLMLETDAPFLAPVPYRGKRCEPAYVQEISQVAAETRGIGLEELAEATGTTARGFFKGLE